MRKKLVAGNWKMHFTPPAARKFAEEMKTKLCTPDVDAVLCVPYVSLQSVMDALAGSLVKVGAQNMHYMDEGAYTGEISGEMLASMGVPYVIIGHSERRERFGETDTTVNLKTLKALQHKITPIVCVGESQRQRREKRTAAVLRKQITFALDEVRPSEMAKIVIAYEPIWAIGTGEAATLEQAEEACEMIREHIMDNMGEKAAQTVRILYGGSVTPENASALFAMPNIDGGLVGGASVKPSFEQVVRYGK
ncbi:MAG: triose-phosphate isomerase [Defluviitaleaceae bacterium]|nr:triose-phosphate isomerase [Defluviitaleaceae bacterium]MCL2203788.1 triose-phosphate isomerase [Defluviitaleaceae bacterium]MCL2239257.1 triose-phosphate isomerase [Defluviitaleaceae bacterium]